jgi:hypothetical protein
MNQTGPKDFICNALNCLNEENKSFSNSLFLPLYLISFSYSLALCLYINMRQLKRIGFICNIFNCLNEGKKKKKVHKFSLFIFSYFLFILFGMHLIDILMKKTKSSLDLIFFLSSLVLCLYLNVRQLNRMCFICNIFNCLNEENRRFTNSLSLFFFLSFLAFSLYLNVRQLKHMCFILNAFN